MKQINVGICGLGTVGSGVCNVLSRNAAVIQGRTGCDIRVMHIGARRDNPLANIAGIQVSRDVFAVVRDPAVDIVVELIGGTDVARELVLEAIAQGKHVVTANKALIAHHGNEIFAAARAKGVTVAFEAAVCGGIPIIKVLREGLAANRIQWLAGIINGTTNFILTEMRDKGRLYADVLKEAQALGYAEADPTFDVEGIDAAHKLVILAALAFGMPLEVKKVFTEGISKLAIADVEYARELGYRIKHLGVARKTDKGVELRVHPTLVPENLLIAKVDGVMNAVMVRADAGGASLYNGPGAGAEPTASSVISDVVDIARALAANSLPQVPALGFVPEAISELPIVAMDNVECEWYLRMSVSDKPGVMSKVTSILSDTGISIEALIQKEPRRDEVTVPLIMLTNVTRQDALLAAVKRIEALDAIQGEVVRIRVETLDQ